VRPTLLFVEREVYMYRHPAWPVTVIRSFVLVEKIVGIVWSAAPSVYLAVMHKKKPAFPFCIISNYLAPGLQNAHPLDFVLVTSHQAGKVSSTPSLACQPQTPGPKSDQMQYVCMVESKAARRSTYHHIKAIAINQSKRPKVSRIHLSLPLEKLKAHVLITHPPCPPAVM
jgi:hypothetical protein